MTHFTEQTVMDGCDWTAVEVFRLGEAVLNWINVMQTLGHTRPGNSLEYMAAARDSDDRSLRLLYDFVACTSGRASKFSPDARDRLADAVIDSGWMVEHVRALHRAAGLDKPPAMTAAAS